MWRIENVLPVSPVEAKTEGRGHCRGPAAKRVHAFTEAGLERVPAGVRPIFIDDLRDDSFIGQLKYKDVLAGLKNEAVTLHSGCHEMDFEPLSAFDGL